MAGSRSRRRTRRKPLTRACGKVRFRDRIAALMALATVRHNDRAGRPKLEQRAYRCNDCHGWHLTSRR